MKTPFEDWLAMLKASEHGPVEWRADRGRIFSANIDFPGDLTGATMRGEVRLGPDTPDPPEAEFNISAPQVGGGETRFNVALAAADVDALPADEPADGFVTLAYDLLITLDGDIERLLFGGPFFVFGRITGDAGS